MIDTNNNFGNPVFRAYLIDIQGAIVARLLLILEHWKLKGQGCKTYIMV